MDNMIAEHKRSVERKKIAAKVALSRKATKRKAAAKAGEENGALRKQRAPRYRENSADPTNCTHRSTGRTKMARTETKLDTSTQQWSRNSKRWQH